MIHRVLHIRNWQVDVFIDNGGMLDFGIVTDCLYDMGVSDNEINRAINLYERDLPNEAFTCSTNKRSCIYIGYTTSGAEFINSLVHEVRHLIDHIAGYYGIKEMETTGYMSGDVAFLLAEEICELGCPHCG